MRMLRASRRLWDTLGYDADFWRGPVILGAMLAGLTWLVWYFTKTPCTIDNAASGLCNPNVVASFINVDIMSRCTAAWLGATTLTGGINAIMLRRERERTEEANRRADEERKRADEERKRADERIETLMNEMREERRQANERIAEERRQADEDRRQSAEAQQVMMAAIAELTATVAEMRQRNGRENGTDSG